MSEINMGSVRFDAVEALAAAADLDALADRLAAALGAETPALSVPAAGADEVSLRAADTLTAVGASFVSQTPSGIDELRKLATALRNQVSTVAQTETDTVVDFISLT